MKTSNDLKKLLHQVTGTGTDGVSRSGLLAPVKSSSVGASIPSSRSLSLRIPPEARPLALSESRTAKGLSFGSPSSSGANRSQGGTDWANLLRQTTTGGISGGLDGGILSAIGGFGGLVSSFAKLFGGGTKTEAPLTKFQLPDSQNQIVLASSYQSAATGARTGSGGIYTEPSGSSPQNAHTPPSQWQSAQITEAVKQALLNSSSLNDVIAEI